MKHSDFRIGQRFTMSGEQWLCTDIGTRVIVAICVTDAKDETWLRGPPYAVVEYAIDQHEFPACEE